MDLNVEEYVSASVCIKDERVAQLMDRWRSFISSEVRVKDLEIGHDTNVNLEYTRDWVVEGVEMKFGISRL